MKKVLVSLVLVVGMVLGGLGQAEVMAAKGELVPDKTEAEGSFSSGGSEHRGSTSSSTADGGICDSGNGISDELKEAAGCNIDDNKTAVPAILNLINIALGVIGLLAVGVIVYGGAQYVLSTGDTAKITKAKNVIVYGVVGLVVSLLAFVIVHFVSGIVG